MPLTCFQGIKSISKTKNFAVPLSIHCELNYKLEGMEVWINELSRQNLHKSKELIP